MQIDVMLPSYEEAENLKLLLPKIHGTMRKIDCEYTITVVDSMDKTDDTDQICEQNNVTYLPRRGGVNYGDAIRTGIAEASGDYIVIMDADGSHNPDDIICMCAEVQKGFDVVIGSRYMSGGNTYNGVILKTMSLIVNLTYRFIFNIKVKDVSNSFRLYDAQKLKSLTLSCDNFDIVEEILILLIAKYNSLRIVEIPIFFNKRLHGESKRDLIKFIFSYIGTIARLYKIKRMSSKM